jgi:hypothetical protein
LQVVTNFDSDGEFVAVGDVVACTASFFAVFADSLMPCRLRLRTSWKQPSSLGCTSYAIFIAFLAILLEGRWPLAGPLIPEG